MNPSDVKEKSSTRPREISNMRGKKEMFVHGDPKIVCGDLSRDHRDVHGDQEIMM